MGQLCVFNECLEYAKLAITILIAQHAHTTARNQELIDIQSLRFFLINRLHSPALRPSLVS